jgi:GH15 family glucan-1,4-alpha-glucosidase
MLLASCLVMAGPRRCQRVDGYAAVRDYAVLGDGRTSALVAADGSVDWLALPNLDSPTVFGSVLDASRGGCFRLGPVGDFLVTRRYLPSTNVLETTFHTAGGAAQVVDALTLPTVRPAPFREIVRLVRGVRGRVELQWRAEPAFGYGQRRSRFGWRGGVPVVEAGSDALALCSWGAGQPRVDEGGIGAQFSVEAGGEAVIALSMAHQEPLVFSGRRDVVRRLEETIAFWEGWSGRRRAVGGPWEGAVLRSALALRLLIFAPSGAIAAAPTASLPEAIGGVRNWDYRYCWIRDSSFVLDALLGLHSFEEAHSFFWWFMHATRRRHSQLRVLYRLDGGDHTPEKSLPLDGYRGSRPVRIGNGAADQRQMDLFGDLLETAWLYASAGHPIDRDTGRALAGTADHVARTWQLPDSGIWEVRSAPRHFTHSKVMCWVALDRAVALARLGALPAGHVARWTAEATAIREFVERQCWSDTLRSYTRSAGDEELDASLLLLPIMRYGDPAGPRIGGTIDAVRRELGHGDIVDRYHGDDGVAGGEGAFLTCSFWLVQALVLAGRREEARSLMDRLVGLANDVGLYSEEVDPRTRDFLGNFPQGLVHLALINAALAFEETAREAKSAAKAGVAGEARPA